MDVVEIDCSTGEKNVRAATAEEVAQAEADAASAPTVVVPPPIEELVDQRIAAALADADTFAQFKLNLLGA